jgi:hypothetical protein
MGKLKTILTAILLLTFLTSQAGKKHKRKKVLTKCINNTCCAYK